MQVVQAEEQNNEGVVHGPGFNQGGEIRMKENC